MIMSVAATLYRVGTLMILIREPAVSEGGNDRP